MKWLPAMRIGALVLLCSTRGATQSPDATLPEVQLLPWIESGNGTGMRFVGLSPAAVDGRELPDETAQRAFGYAIDAAPLKWGSECYCYRYFAVTVRSRKTGKYSEHKFKGIPSGSFEDQRVPVRLTITEGATSDTDDVTLPVASAPGLEPKGLVEVMTPKTMALPLGGVTEIPVTLRNPNRVIPVQIPSQIILTIGNGAVWKRPPAFADANFPLVLEPQRAKALILRLEPRVWQAISTSFPPTTSDTAHTTIRLDVPYTNAIFSNRFGNVSVEVPVRFQPGLLALLLWLAFGVALGTLVPLVSGGKKTLIQWPQAAAAALVVALVLELVGMLLVQTKSKFVLFNFDLDPWQTLSVVILGIANGLLGLKAAAGLRKWIPIGGGNVKAP